MSHGPINILLIEDNPPDTTLVREMLSQDVNNRYRLTHASRLSQRMKHLATLYVGVILLDLSLPDSQGIKTFMRIRAQAPWMPIVVFSGSTGEAVALQTVHQGAQDDLVGGQVTEDLLMCAIHYVIEHKQIEKTLRESEEWYRLLPLLRKVRRHLHRYHQSEAGQREPALEVTRSLDKQ